MFPSPVHLCQRQPESDGAEQPGIRNKSGTSPKLSAVSRQHHFWPTWPLFRRPRDGLSHGPNTSSYHRVARRQQHNKSCNPLVVSPTLQGHNVCAHERRGRRPSPIGRLLLDWAPLINADLRCALRAMAHHDSSYPAWSCGIRARFSVSGRGCASSNLCLYVRRPM